MNKRSTLTGVQLSSFNDCQIDWPRTLCTLSKPTALHNCKTDLYNRVNEWVSGFHGDGYAVEYDLNASGHIDPAYRLLCGNFQFKKKSLTAVNACQLTCQSMNVLVYFQ